MKKLRIGIVMSILVVATLAYLNTNTPKGVDSTPENKAPSDPLNISYVVDGETFLLVDGSAEKDIVPGSVIKNTLSVFGEPSYGDIDGDGDDDAVLLLVNSPGGSGAFYYVAIAVNTDGDYTATDTMLLGDRIAPQNFSIEGNKAVVNYAVRNVGEDFSVQPSLGKTVALQYDPATLQLIQVAVNFEGEANPDTMMLDMQPWTWVKTTYNNDMELVPAQSDSFTLTFKDDNTVAITTDCNSMSASYGVEGHKMVFGPLVSTKMFCQDSQEQDFVAMLAEVQSYFFTSKGELVFDLKFDSGSTTFR